MSAPFLALVADTAPRTPGLIAAQALNAEVNGVGDPVELKAELHAAITKATGLSPSMMALLRMQGLLP